VNQRLNLLLIAAVLVGGALYLAFAPPAQQQPPPQAVNDAPSTPPTFGLYTFAVSWEPAFCETEPDKTECQSQYGRFEASHLALHGLWPQDEYCGVSQSLIDADINGPRSALPKVDISPGLKARLDVIMPGTRSQLERHEWLMHGTCANTTAETYYERTIDLLTELNTSAVGHLFTDSVGKRITADAILSAFDKAFGNGASRKVRIDCVEDGNRTLIEELRIRLYGDVMGDVPFKALINRANATNQTGCAGGIIDRPFDQ
jgi:ribonuclease T2